MSHPVSAVPLLLSAGLVLMAGGSVAQKPGPGQPAATPPRFSSADEKAIRAILKDQETAWNNHDMDAFTKAFRDDAEGVNIVGMYWRGKSRILKHLSYYHTTNFKDLEETVEDVHVHPIGEGVAIAVVVWKVGAFTAPSGVPFPAARHRSTLVLAKGTRGWQVVHFHNTSIDEKAVKGDITPPAQ